MDFDQTQSIEENNSNIPIQYQHCPHCNRKFFKGKLKYHLKLCTADNPMVKSPHKTSAKRQHNLTSHQNQQIFNHQQIKCPKCSMRLPSFLIDRHAQKCSKMDDNKNLENIQEQHSKKAVTDIHFKQKQGITLPLIIRPTKQLQAQQTGFRNSYKVKIRKDLSCFKKAQEIKQIQCPSCGRVFSKAASLRHFPICQALKTKVQKSIALYKKPKKTNKSAIQQAYNLSTERAPKYRSAFFDISSSKRSVQQKQKQILPLQKND